MVGNQAVHSGKVTGKKPEVVEVEERALLLEHKKRLKVRRTPPKTQRSIRDFLAIIPSGQQIIPYHLSILRHFQISWSNDPARGKEKAAMKQRWTLSSGW